MVEKSRSWPSRMWQSLTIAFRSPTAKEVYVSSTKRQKMTISRSIVEAVRALEPPGRFLEKDRTTGFWVEIDYKKAIEKTSQALRDGAASLRKQLSADFGDPNFLNSVFDENEGDDKSQNDPSSGDSVTSSVESGKGSTVDAPRRSEAQTRASDKGEESSPPRKGTGEDDAKVDPTLVEKKVTTTKKVSTKNSVPKTLPAKRGLRRSRSNPCLAASTIKPNRKSKQYYREKYGSSVPSPRTPMTRHASSQPGSPMTWGSHQPYHENADPGSFVPWTRFSPYHHPSSPPPRGYVSHEKGYDQPPYDPRFSSRSYSYDHYGTETYPDYHHSSSWPPDATAAYSAQASSGHPTSGTSSYPWGYYPGNRSPGGRTPPRHPRSGSATATSPLPRGALPPGRHQFSPAGYRSDPPEHEPSHRHDEYYGYSPRQAYESRSPAYGEHQSPRWRSPYGGDYYGSPAPSAYATSYCESVNTSYDSNLSVPSLGGENRHHGLPEAKMLLPRPRESGADTPARQQVSSRDFAPPASKCRPRIIRRREPHTYAWEQIEGYRPDISTSKTGEEKKTENETASSFEVDRTVSTSKSSPPPHLEADKGVLSLRASINRSADCIVEPDDGMAIDRPDSVRSSPSLTVRSSPLLARINIVPTDCNYTEHVEDIEMSPISQADHEDPSTLMHLPDNLMTLPISPCGPHDDPR